MRWVGERRLAIRDLTVCVDHMSEAKEDWMQYHGGCVALLAQVPNLQRLCISIPKRFMVPEQHLSALGFLTNLQTLTLKLDSNGEWSAMTLEPLKVLTALTHLSIGIQSLQGALLVSPELAKLTQLQTLYLRALNSNRINQGHLMDTISRLSGLTGLDLNGMVNDAPAELAALEHLQAWYFRAPSPSYANTKFTIPACLTSCSNLSYISLANLSQATVRAWWGLCRSLLCLPALDSISFIDTNLADALPAAWAPSTRLTFLNLSNCNIDSLPSAACQLPLLQHLRMIGMPLLHLPGGEYLQHMRRMAIHCDRNTLGATNLADACHLESLRVTANEGPEAWSQAYLASILPGGCAIIVYNPDDSECDNYTSGEEY